jgi:hypothetical protein
MCCGHVASESVDLIYDPPFNSNRNYNVIFARHNIMPDPNSAQMQAFDDTWRWTPVTEGQYLDLTRGGLPNEAGDALSAFHTLLGENDAMAYLVKWAIHFIATPAHGDPPPEANGAGQGLEHSRGGSQMDSPPGEYGPTVGGTSSRAQADCFTLAALRSDHESLP